MATVKINRASDNEPRSNQKAKQDWYADAEGNVSNDSSTASFHIAAKGQEILPHIAAKYGFVDGEVAKGRKAEAAGQQSESKGQAPTENKAAESKADPKPVSMAADQKPAAKK